MIKLSVSGRLVEVGYRYCEMDVPEFLTFAHDCGYDAVELRATQLKEDLTVEEAEEFRRLADELGMGFSCCIPPGVRDDEGGLQGIERFVPIARVLGCDVLKVWVGEAGWLRDACDLVRPHGLRIVVQTHAGGPFESVDSCLGMIAGIGRDNFGLQYDPANLFIAGRGYGEEAVKRLGGHILQLSVQNVRPAKPDEPGAMEEEGFYYARCPLWDPRGLDFSSVLRGLRAVGFEGYITLNEPKPISVPVREFAVSSARELRRLVEDQFGREDEGRSR